MKKRVYKLIKEEYYNISLILGLSKIKYLNSESSREFIKALKTKDISFVVDYLIKSPQQMFGSYMEGLVYIILSKHFILFDKPQNEWRHPAISNLKKEFGKKESEFLSNKLKDKYDYNEVKDMPFFHRTKKTYSIGGGFLSVKKEKEFVHYYYNFYEFLIPTNDYENRTANRKYTFFKEHPLNLIDLNENELKDYDKKQEEQGIKTNKLCGELCFPKFKEFVLKHYNLKQEDITLLKEALLSKPDCLDLFGVSNNQFLDKPFYFIEVKSNHIGRKHLPSFSQSEKAFIDKFKGRVGILMLNILFPTDISNKIRVRYFTPIINPQ